VATVEKKGTGNTGRRRDVIRLDDLAPRREILGGGHRRAVFGQAGPMSPGAVTEAGSARELFEPSHPEPVVSGGAARPDTPPFGTRNRVPHIRSDSE
jgi:hypothetical protein